MLERLTSETFADYVGNAFDAAPAEGDPLRLVLSRCEEAPYGSSGGSKQTLRRVPFSLSSTHRAIGSSLSRRGRCTIRPWASSHCSWFHSAPTRTGCVTRP